jgi:hypothetical protein
MRPSAVRPARSEPSARNAMASARAATAERRAAIVRIAIRRCERNI